MRYLWDSDTCVQHLRGRDFAVTARLEASMPGDIVLCSIVRAELRFGAFKHRNPAQEVARLEKFFDMMDSLPFDNAAADRAAEVRFVLSAAGTPIGPHDLQIAAIALANNLAVVTRNSREFVRVPGLRIENWSD